MQYRWILKSAYTRNNLFYFFSLGFAWCKQLYPRLPVWQRSEIKMEEWWQLRNKSLSKKALDLVPPSSAEEGVERLKEIQEVFWETVSSRYVRKAAPMKAQQYCSPNKTERQFQMISPCMREISEGPTPRQRATSNWWLTSEGKLDFPRDETS